MPECVGFFGEMSSGKGIASTIFLKYCLKNYPRRIISNCWLKLEKYTRLTTEEFYDKLLENISFFDNSYLYISELHNIVDSRRSGSALNTTFTQKVTQLGKRDCKLIYDSQMFGQIDIRLRDFTPYRIICRRFKIINNKLIQPNFYDGRILKDKEGNYIPIAIKRILNYTDKDDKEVYKNIPTLYPTQEDFDFYNTREIITLDRDKYLRK